VRPDLELVELTKRALENGHVTLCNAEATRIFQLLVLGAGLVDCECCGELTSDPHTLTKTFDAMVDGPGLLETESRVLCPNCFSRHSASPRSP
jgi:hypothetical protein